MDHERMVQIIANTLSAITIISCLFLKVPQIMSIREKKSAEGIYVKAMLMEISGFTIVTVYNYMSGYSVLTYLEYPIILIQIYVMLYYVLKYKRMLHKNTVRFGVAAYILTIAAFLLGVLPEELLSYMVVSGTYPSAKPVCTPLSGFAKVTYIYGIVMAANANAVSVTTWVISLATNLARLFTVYMDSADKKLMVNFGISALLSATVLATALYYKAWARYQVALQRERRASNTKPFRMHPSHHHRD